jgi:hypothetical protein
MHKRAWSCLCRLILFLRHFPVRLAHLLGLKLSDFLENGLPNRPILNVVLTFSKIGLGIDQLHSALFAAWLDSIVSVSHCPSSWGEFGLEAGVTLQF